MNLRTKVFLFTGVIFVSFFILIGFVFQHILMDDFSTLEKHEMERNFSRITEAVNGEMDALTVTLDDWAQWDDTYDYIDTHDDAYIRSNLQGTALQILHMNFVVLFDEKGDILFKKFVRDGEDRVFPQGFQEHLETQQKEDAFSDQNHFQGAHQEMFHFSEGVLLYAAQSITSSDGLAPPRGTIVFGYFFDEASVRELSQLTRLDITFEHYDDKESVDEGFIKARQHLSAEQNHFIDTERDADTLFGYTLLQDNNSHPILILRVAMPRDIYRKGLASVHLFYLFIFLSGLLLSVSIFYMLHHFILNKIALLSSEVGRIRRMGSAKDCLVLSGGDEFSKLAEEMCRMLSTLYENEAVLKRQAEDLRKFEQAVDASFEHMIITDANGIILHANHAAEVLTGYSKEEMIGYTPSLWGRQMPGKFYETMWQTIKVEKQGYTGDITNKRKSGALYLASIRISPIFDEAGAVKFFVGIERDITEEREVQRRIIRHADELEVANVHIEEQKNRAESILRFLKSLGEGVLATDMTGNIIFSNEAAKVLSMRTMSEVEGQMVSEVFPFVQEVKDRFVMIHPIEQTLEKRLTYSFPSNTFLLQRSGERVPVSGTCSLILDMKGVVIGAIVVFRDVTKLRELDQMKNNFLSTAAHQLRTPLGSMRWSAELLLNGDLGRLPKAAKEVVQQIYDNNVRMVLLVNDLLDVSRIDSERGREKKSPVSIVSLLQEIIRTMESEARKRSVRIIFIAPKEPLPILLMPAKHLYEAIENLISNGIKYNKEQGTLTLSLTLRKESISLSIADTGIGIPKDDTEKIFSKFFRSTNAVLKEMEGSGLGLSVVKSYLEESGVKISFESTENIGTTFFLEFPLDSTSTNQ